MKKLSIFLAFVLLLSVFSVTAYANDIPIKAEVIENGDELKVKVYVNEVTKLVSLRVIVEYDTQKYEYKGGKESVYTDENGDEFSALSGMWVFGELANHNGCIGAFVSVNGVTKKGETEICEFTLVSNSAKANSRDISISVTEFITDDNNEENDIYEKTIISYDIAISNEKVVYNTINKNGVLTLTGIDTKNDAVFVPDKIDGCILRGIKPEKALDIPILIFGRNILSVKEDAFSSFTTVVAPKSTAPVAVAKMNGARYLEYNESIVIDSENKYFLTDEFLVNNNATLFSGDAPLEITPSYIYAGGYFGTGSIVTVFGGSKILDLSLCVKGDANGDSVCDVIDVTLCEKQVNGLNDLGDVEKAAMDISLDGKVTVEDYARIVNISLDNEYKIFDGVRGDINGDYTVDALDIVEYNRMLKRSDLSSEEMALCDFDNDGKLTAFDKEILVEIVMNFM